MENEWWSKVFPEIQKAFDKKNLELFYGLMREIFGQLTSSIALLRSRVNTIIIKEPEKNPSAIAEVLHQFTW